MAAARTGHRAAARRRAPDSTAGQRAGIAAAVRREVERAQAAAAAHRLRRHADPAQTTPSTDPTRGPVARERLRRATGWCWSTSSRTPTRCSGASCARRSTAHRTLVLIGDPKQAIYGFRGADVHAYLEATGARPASVAPCRRTGAATRCCSTGSTPSSAARRSATRASRCCPVESAHPGRMVDAPVGARCGCGWSRRDDPATGTGQDAGDGPTRDAVAADLAAEVVGAARPTHVAPATARRQSAADVRRATSRCWCTTNSRRQLVQRALARPACRSCSPARPASSPPLAAEWQLLLEALEQPHRTTRVRRPR